MTDAMAEKKSKQAIRARRVYLRMRLDEINSEMARNLEELRVITAALPKTASGPERKAMRMRANYLQNRNPALAEERTVLIAEDETLQPPETTEAQALR
jgi:hypothetical protein